MHRLRRKLSEPRTAGQRSADAPCSQRATSEGDSESACFVRHVMLYTCSDQAKSHEQNRKKPASFSAKMHFATETRLVPCSSPQMSCQDRKGRLRRSALSICSRQRWLRRELVVDAQLAAAA